MNLTWGSAAYASCQQPFTWQQLTKGPCTEVASAACSSYPLSDVFRTGGLGKLMEVGGYESWICLHMDRLWASYASMGSGACGDPWFCWVYHETLEVFTPWGPDSQLGIVLGAS